MEKTLCISLDLGGDSLKVAFAYEGGTSGGISYGKLSGTCSALRIAYPAVACQKGQGGEWLYCDAVDKAGSLSFVRVVKMKELLSLLLYPDVSEYYFKSTRFPRFVFPRRKDARDRIRSFASLSEGEVFDGGITPQRVLENYFHCVALMIKERVEQLCKKTGEKLSLSSCEIAVVHPPKVTKAYVEELSRLVLVAFGKAPAKVLTTTRSLGMYAKHRGLFSKVNEALIVDMGEEDVSVARAFLSGGNVFVDGDEGHLPPLALGGNDVDYAIADNIMERISRRSHFGCPPDVHEPPVLEKQYMFMKSVKSAKISVSKQGDGSGEPVASWGIHYETYKQGTLSGSEFREIIGTAKGTGIAARIAEYVLRELSGEVNEEITDPSSTDRRGAVILSGGLAECYSLKEYLKGEIKKKYSRVDVVSFDELCESGDGFAILSHEDSAYAPALGGAIVALKNEEIKTGLSLSYATWGCYRHYKVLCIFVDKGTPIKEGDVFDHEFSFSPSNNGRATEIQSLIKGECIYSTTIRTKDLAVPGAPSNEFYEANYRGKRVRCLYKDGKYYLVLGPDKKAIDSPSVKEFEHLRRDGAARARAEAEMAALEAHIHLKTVAGNEDSDIKLFLHTFDTVRRRRVDRQIISLLHAESGRVPDSLWMREAVVVDGKGRIDVKYDLIKPKPGYATVYRVRFGDMAAGELPPRSSVDDMFIEGPPLNVKLNIGE